MKPYLHRVQYYETDMMGVVHHSNYIRWMEEARIDFMDQLGFPYARMEAEGVLSPVKSVGHGITCNAVAPGFFDSEMNRSIQELRPEMYKMVSDKIPLSQGGWGKIADLMGTIVFLASPASDYVTGVVIAVDGGFKAQMI